jgi:mono/diheme cytochrome c family protein
MKLILLSVLAAGIFSVTPLAAQDGTALYKQNCAVCHTVGKGKLVGPDLKGAHAKYEEPWLIKWIKSSQTLVKSNDEKAVKLFNENNKMVMPDVSLAEEEIKSIIGYIKDETTRLDQPVVEAPAQTATVNKVNAGSTSEVSSGGRTNTVTIMLSVGIAVLLIVVIIMGNIIETLAQTRKVE